MIVVCGFVQSEVFTKASAVPVTLPSGFHSHFPTWISRQQCLCRSLHLDLPNHPYLFLPLYLALPCPLLTIKVKKFRSAQVNVTASRLVNTDRRFQASCVLLQILDAWKWARYVVLDTSVASYQPTSHIIPRERRKPYNVGSEGSSQWNMERYCYML